MLQTPSVRVGSNSGHAHRLAEGPLSTTSELGSVWSHDSIATRRLAEPRGAKFRCALLSVLEGKYTDAYLKDAGKDAPAQPLVGKLISVNGT